jgi:hypothetical protein
LEYVQVDPLAHTVAPVYPSPPHCPYFATVPEPVLVVVVVAFALEVVVPLPEDTTIAGIEMLAIVQILPPSEDARPVYVVPPETPRVDPKVGSADAKVITVFRYV